MTLSTGPIKGVDLPALSSWLASHIEGVTPPFKVSILAGGHSNLTYRVDDAAGASFALRRPPLGKLAARAHDMSREFRIYSALNRTPLPVPQAVTLCEDETVIGAPFYLMRFVRGAVVDTPAEVDKVLPTEDMRTRAAYNLADTLATLHHLDVDRIGLGELGPRQNYLDRQLKRYIGIWDKTKTRDLPAIEKQHQRLVALQPPQRYTGIVHSDYRLGNVMLDPAANVAAVLDWELCALGDVLVDVGFLIDNWDEKDDPGPSVWMQDPPTRAGGFPGKDDIVARYAQTSGFDVSSLDYYRAFSYWRMAIIGEGIKRRYESGALGTDVDPGFVEQRIRNRIEMTETFLARADNG